MKKNITLILLLTWPYLFNDIYLIFINCDNLALLWILDVIFFTLIPSITLYILYTKKYISVVDMGFGIQFTMSFFILGILLCFLLLFVVQSIVFPILFNALPKPICCSYDFPGDGFIRIAFIFYAAITAAFFEEVICRGIIVHKLKEIIGSNFLIVVVSAAIFSLLHWCQGPGKMISMFIWAIIPTIWVIKNGHIWGTLTCHFFYGLLIYLGFF